MCLAAQTLPLWNGIEVGDCSVEITFNTRLSLRNSLGALKSSPGRTVGHSWRRKA